MSLYVFSQRGVFALINFQRSTTTTVAIKIDYFSLLNVQRREVNAVLSSDKKLFFIVEKLVILLCMNNLDPRKKSVSSLISYALPPKMLSYRIVFSSSSVLFSMILSQFTRVGRNLFYVLLLIMHWLGSSKLASRSDSNSTQFNKQYLQ